MKKFKLVPVQQPPKFQPGDRVKPTQLGMKNGWRKPGTVESCGHYIVTVRMDGEKEAITYTTDYWEAE